MKEEIKKLHSNGMINSEIARKVGCSPQYVSQIINNYKYKIQYISYANRPDLILGSFCVKCNERGIEIHHKDRNSSNNIRENLMLLCRKCHANIHTELGRRSPRHRCIKCNNYSERKFDKRHKSLCNSCFKIEAKKRKKIYSQDYYKDYYKKNKSRYFDLIRIRKQIAT